MSPAPVQPVALGPEDDAERIEWMNALSRVIDNRSFCLGAEVEAFEREVAAFLGVEHAVGLSNGTDALRLGLHALGVGPGDEVIVPAFSFFATASTALHLGATPVFVDVDDETLNMDAAAAERAITERTKAIVPAHLYGQGGDMAALHAVAERAGVPILEDAAQVFGVRIVDGPFEGRCLGTIGAAGTFSFYPTKNLGAPGDAGMLITNDAEMAARVRALRVHGDRGGYQHEALGYNARMDGFQAAILRTRLARHEARQARRTANARHYLDRLPASVRTVGQRPEYEHGWHQFVVRVSDRDGLRRHLAEHGINTGVHYPRTLPSQPALAKYAPAADTIPVATAAAAEVLALPIHPRLTTDELDRVVAAITAYLA